MRLPRIYAIQTKLSLVFLLLTAIMVISGLLYVYYSNRHLRSARLFVDRLVPQIQRTNSLQLTASRVKGYSRELTQTVTRAGLHLVYKDLTTVLNEMERLTTTISNQDSGIDIVSLNFLNQAIRSQAQLVFQLKALLLEKEGTEQSIINGIRRDLLYLFVLESEMGKIIPPRNHSMLHSLQDRLILLLEQLDRPSLTLLNVEQVRSRLSKIKTDVEHHLFNPPDSPEATEARELVNGVMEQAERLFTAKRQFLEIHGRIGIFKLELNEQTDRLTRLTNHYIQGVRQGLQNDTESILDRERRTIKITLIGLILAILILYLVHRKIIVQGFGNRLSLISRAMGSRKSDKAPLPVDGKDEIADMARAAKELLGKAEKLRTLATLDELTGIFNRRRFFQLAAKEAERAARNQLPAVLLMLDIDHFKKINDTWGHDFGDKTLNAFAKACSRVTRKVDLFARYGGEEFVLLMPETTPEQGKAAGERLLETIASLELTTACGKQVGMTVSIGMAVAPTGVRDINQWIKTADTALYRAKQLGRNRLEIFSEKMETI